MRPRESIPVEKHAGSLVHWDGSDWNFYEGTGHIIFSIGLQHSGVVCRNDNYRPCFGCCTDFAKEYHEKLIMETMKIKGG